MAGHPQSSPRGLIQKTGLGVGDELMTDGGSGVKFSQGVSISDRSNLLTEDSNGNFIAPVGLSLSAKTSGFLTQNSTGLILPAGLHLSAKTSNAMTQNSTGVKFPQGIALSGKTSFVTQNSTGMIYPTVAAKPAARSSCKIAVVTNTTGANFLCVNTTGATWKYLNVTTVAPS